MVTGTRGRKGTGRTAWGQGSRKGTGLLHGDRATARVAPTIDGTA